MSAMRGPDFICVGQQKAGTGFLYDLLATNSGIWMPPMKEFHYFNGTMTMAVQKAQRFQRVVDRPDDKRTRRAVANKVEKADLDNRDIEFFRRLLRLSETRKFDDYCECFSVKGEQISGDITPAYSVLDAAEIAEIHAGLPEAKIILLIRRPDSRFWSHFNQAMRISDRGRGHLPEDATNVQTVRKFLKKPGVIKRSFPSAIYKRWTSAFSPERVLVMSFETLTRDTPRAAQKLSAFLGVPEAFTYAQVANRKEKARKVSADDDVKAFLEKHFRDEVAECKRLFGDECAAW